MHNTKESRKANNMNNIGVRDATLGKAPHIDTALVVVSTTHFMHNHMSCPPLVGDEASPRPKQHATLIREYVLCRIHHMPKRN